MRFVQAVPDGLGQCSAGVEEHLHARQQGFAQQVVGFHRVGNGFKPSGHVEVDGRRDFAQVAQGLADHRGCGFAVVDVQRAAVVEHHADVVIATEGVVPRQPVDQHQLFFGQHRHGLRHLLLVGAPQALRVDDGLGHLGRAAGEQKLDNGVWAGGGNGGVDSRGCNCCAQALERGDLAAIQSALDHNDFHVPFNRGGNGFGVAGVRRKDQARRHCLEHMFELVVVHADERVGR